MSLMWVGHSWKSGLRRLRLPVRITFLPMWRASICKANVISQSMATKRPPVRCTARRSTSGSRSRSSPEAGMLGPRIKRLAAAGKLTADIAEWSDHVRDVGNEPDHEERPVTRNELADLRNFTEMVLRYLFSLPGARALRMHQCSPAVPCRRLRPSPSQCPRA